ncbi:DUF4209 domain-containing protein [Gordonia polyisoprenivorans]|uniref:DUF4209 domain-containing protein n=1 Tax=Gordonia polyisoprenivorans TaxID=84595 RepID=UPI0023007936|nr:DUF4209 domain-containing protein [Gordonia polyisoprenivorans]WCB36931.1 DUF4209 domain-containing protein [Gordonia polyisoprenivorans]
MTEDGACTAADGSLAGEVGSQPEHPASTAYEFDPADPTRAASVLDAVFERGLLYGWEGWTATKEILNSQGVELPEALRRAIMSITCRPIKLDMAAASAELVDAAPSLPDLAEVSEDEKRLWREIAGMVTVPAARARIGEILIATDPKTIGAQLPSVVNGYLSAVDGHEGMAAVVYLLRGYTLCRRLNASEFLAQVVDEIESRVAKASVSNILTSPGTYFLMLQVLVEVASRKTVGVGMQLDLAAILEELAETVAIDYLASRLAAMRRRLLDLNSAETVTLIATQEVEGYLRNADEASEPLVKLAQLESALKLADRRGLTLMSREISSRMQALGNEDLGFAIIRTAEAIPAYIPESYLEEFTQFLTWRGGLQKFMLQPDAPSGPVASHKAFAASHRGSLSRLFPPKILGRDNLPRVTLSTDDDLDRHDMATSSRLFAETYGRWGAYALVRMRDMYGIPELDEITLAICEMGARDIELSRSLARGFIHFWSDDIESCVAVVTPRIEAAARALLRELDEGIYRVEKENSQGGYIMLYSLLARLEELALDPDWAWFLRWLLLGDVGVNLRNDQAHGFLSSVPIEYAALLLRAASVLITASPRIGDATKRVELATASANPVSPWLCPIDRVLHCSEVAAARVYIGLVHARKRLSRSLD